MVILHVKRSDLNQFLYETNTSVPVADLLDQLVRSKCSQFIFENLVVNFFIFSNSEQSEKQAR